MEPRKEEMREQKTPQARKKASKRRIGIMTRRGRSLSPAAEALVAVLKTAATQARSAADKNADKD